MKTGNERAHSYNDLFSFEKKNTNNAIVLTYDKVLAFSCIFFVRAQVFSNFSLSKFQFFNRFPNTAYMKKGRDKKRDGVVFILPLKVVFMRGSAR